MNNRRITEVSFKHWDGQHFRPSNVPKIDAPQAEALDQLTDHQKNVDKIAKVWALFVTSESRATFHTIHTPEKTPKRRA
jgi:hypothetical protein